MMSNPIRLFQLQTLLDAAETDLKNASDPRFELLDLSARREMLGKTIAALRKEIAAEEAVAEEIGL